MSNINLDEKYSLFFSEQNIYELVNWFNRETTMKGWVGARGTFLNAIMKSFEERDLDASVILSTKTIADKPHTTMSLQFPVYYNKHDKKLIQIKPKKSYGEVIMI